MLKNSSIFRDAQNLAPLRTATVRRDKTLEEVSKAHKCWPFTVLGAFAALQSEKNSLEDPGAASSFVS